MQSGYYKLINKFSDEDYDRDDMEVGCIYYAHVVGDGVEFLIPCQHGHSCPHFSNDELNKYFEFVPDGFIQRQQQITDLMGDLNKISHRQQQLSIETQQLPSLPAPEDIEDEEPESTAVTIREFKLSSKIAGQIKRTKTAVAITRTAILRKQTALKKLLKEHSLILQTQTELLNAQIELATEAIYMINAYLGKDEQLVRIRSGNPAPEECKIVVRQLVLFMDEEAAAAEGWAERGGIDFEKVEQFDEWVKKPENLKRVLPEEKGIVAIKPRRDDKFYSDNPFVNSELNRHNKCLYLLVRNGEILYRIFTTLWIEDVLFPRRDEFEKFFYKEGWHGEDPKPLRPGSPAYMEAMKNAQAHQRRFYTVLLLIQGILDRTKVLKPLPVERLNVCDLHESTKYMTFLVDAEMLLGDGRPTFDDWLNKNNDQMQVGHRVIGCFDSYHMSAYQRLDGRISPKHAYRPDSFVLHTIDGTKNGEMFFYYRRETWRGEEATRRARFTVYPSDSFILDFDSVKTNDLEYYMESRLHRHDYQHMLPLLKVASNMKKKEQKTESPFRLLLIGEIMKAHNASREKAETLIDELISWWKFKNKTYRALTSDDSKAIRMIVKEFKGREALRTEEETRSEINKAFVDQILLGENVLGIFRRPDEQYAVIRYHNDDNIYVTEEIWNESLVESKSWKTMDKRHERWLKLWAHERWNSWNFEAREAEHLTDPERDEASKYAIQTFKKHVPYHADKKRLWMIPLAIAEKDNSIFLYFVSDHALIPTEKILTSSKHEPQIGRMDVKWAKKKGVLHFVREDTSTVCVGLEPGEAPWLPKYKGALWGAAEHKVLKIFEDNIALVREEQCRYDAFLERVEKADAPINRVQHQVNDALVEAWYKEQHEKFLEEYEDDEEQTFWQEFKQSLKEDRHWVYWFDHPCKIVVDHGHDIHGMTVDQVFQLANTYEKSQSKKPSRRKMHRFEDDDDYAPERYDMVKDIVLNVHYGEEIHLIEQQ